MKKYFLLLLLLTCAVFQSQAHVELIYPVGGETFNQGETVNIEWKVLIPHNTLNWDLYFSEDGGSSWDPIQLDIPVGTLSYQWVVPATATSQGRIKVVQDNDGPDYQDTSGDFTITTITGIGEQAPTLDIKVYPNPFHSQTKIVTENFSPGEKMEFVMFDLSGREVYRTAITSSPYILDRPVLPNGIYLWKATGREGIATGKLVLE